MDKHVFILQYIYLEIFLKIGTVIIKFKYMYIIKMNLVGPFSKIVTMKHFLNPILKPVCKTFEAMDSNWPSVRISHTCTLLKTLTCPITKDVPIF